MCGISCRERRPEGKQGAESRSVDWQSHSIRTATATTTTITTIATIFCFANTLHLSDTTRKFRIITILLFVDLTNKPGARGSVVGWGTMLQAGRSPVRVPDEVDFFNLPNPSSRTTALGSTQPRTKMSTRNLPGGKKLPARRADNLPTICEPNIWKCGSLNLSEP
jgi:hypothetical protein